MKKKLLIVIMTAVLVICSVAVFAVIDSEKDVIAQPEAEDAVIEQPEAEDTCIEQPEAEDAVIEQTEDENNAAASLDKGNKVFDVEYERKHKHYIASYVDLQTGNEFFNKVANQKWLYPADVCALHLAKEFMLLDLTYDEAMEKSKTINNNTEECLIRRICPPSVYVGYAEAIAMGEDLANVLYARELGRRKAEVGQAEADKSFNKVEIGKIAEFELKVLEDYVLPYMQNGEYDTAIDYLHILNRYAAAERHELYHHVSLFTPERDYSSPNLDIILQRLADGEMLNDILYCDLVCTYAEYLPSKNGMYVCGYNYTIDCPENLYK